MVQNKRDAANGASIKFIGENAAEQDSFGSHSALARTLATIIADHMQLKVIGLLGSWGSGKSTVIRLLASCLPARGGMRTHIFTYDAWLHQSDPPKRAFLERLIDFLESEDLLKAEDWHDDLGILDRRIEDSETISTPKMPAGGWLILLSILCVPLGARFSGSDWFGKMMNSPPSEFEGWVFAIGVALMIAPVIIMGLLNWSWRNQRNPFSCSFWKPENWRHYRKGVPHPSLLALLLNRLVPQESKRTIKTPEPTTIEFQTVFRKIFDAVSGSERRFVIVIDNLDRLSADEAVAMWTTIRSFFLGTSASEAARALLPTVILPIDEKAITKMFPNGDGQEDAIRSFMDKTFDIMLHVAPPVLSGWHAYLADQLRAALGEDCDSDSGLQISRIFGRTIKEGAAVTPRQLNKLVNAIAIYWMQRADDRVPLVSIGYYIIHRAAIDENIYAALRQPLFDISEDDPDWQRSLAALHFGVPAKEALQILLRDRLDQALTLGAAAPIREAASIAGFERVLVKLVDDMSEGDEIIPAIEAISEARIAESEWLRHIWRKLRRQFLNLHHRMGSQAMTLSRIFDTCPAGERNNLLILAAQRVTESGRSAGQNTPGQLVNFIDVLWQLADGQTLPRPEVHIGDNAVYFLEIASSLSAKYGEELALVHTSGGDAIADAYADQLMSGGSTLLGRKAWLVLGGPPPKDWTRLVNAAEAALQTMVSNAEALGAAGNVIGRLIATNEHARSSAENLMSQNIVQQRIRETLFTSEWQTAATLVALQIASSRALDQQADSGGWEGVIQADPDFPNRVKDALALFTDAANLPLLIDQAVGRESLYPLVRPIITSYLKDETLGQLPVEEILADSARWFGILGEEEQGPLADYLASDPGFWDALPAEGLSPSALLLYRIIGGSRDVAPDHRDKARQQIQTELGHLPSIIWEDAVRRFEEPLPTLFAIQNSSAQKLALSPSLHAALLALISEMIWSVDRPYAIYWFAAARLLLTTDEKRAIFADVRDQLLSGQAIPNLAGLIETAGESLFLDGDFAQRADETVRQILIPLLAQPGGRKIAIQSPSEFAAIVEESSRQSRRLLKASIEQGEVASTDPDGMHLLLELLNLGAHK